MKLKSLSYISITSTLFFIILFGVSQSSVGQEIALSPIASYQLGNHFTIKQGLVRLEPSASYGVSLIFKTNSRLYIEAFWSKQNTNIAIKDITGKSELLFDAAINYVNIRIGEELELDRLRVFISGGLGVMGLSPMSTQVYDETKKTISLSGGIKYFINDRLGIKLQFQSILPIPLQRAGVLCRMGNCGSTASGFTLSSLGSIGGGIIILLKNN